MSACAQHVFASTPRGMPHIARPKIRIPRQARRETVDVQLDLETLLAAAVIEQALLIRALAPALMESARKAFSADSPHALLNPMLHHTEILWLHARRIALLFAAGAALGRAQVRRSAGLTITGPAGHTQFSEILGGVPPQQAISWLQKLKVMNSREWEEASRRYNAQAFRITGIESEKVLQAMKQLLIESLQNGRSLAEFEANAKDLLRMYQKSAGQMRTIWNTNVGQAMSRGREEELNTPELLQLVPWRMFDAMNDMFTRPNHLAGDNGVAPAEWWSGEGADLRPLLGFNCRCVLLGLTKTRALRMIDAGTAVDFSDGAPSDFYKDPNFD